MKITHPVLALFYISACGSPQQPSDGRYLNDSANVGSRSLVLTDTIIHPLDIELVWIRENKDTSEMLITGRKWYYDIDAPSTGLADQDRYLIDDEDDDDDDF